MFHLFNQSNKLTRIKIPGLIDLITVSNPDQIKQIETSGEVDRLHAYPTASLPGWVKFYFKATKFHDVDRDLWFCPFESKSNPTYQPRRAYLEEKVAIGYRPEDVQHIAHLLKTNADDQTLTDSMVQLVNRRFFEQDIPPDIMETAKHTLQNISETILPWNYLRGQRSQQQIMAYCSHALPKGVHLVDAGHNIGEVVQATAGAVKTLNAHLDQSIEEIFTVHAPTAQVPRIAIEATTFNGLLSKPTVPGQTVLIFKVAEAAAQTQDLLFTFGAGTPDRVCVFKDFFLSFMTDLQQALRAPET